MSNAKSESKWITQFRLRDSGSAFSLEPKRGSAGGRPDFSELSKADDYPQEEPKKQKEEERKGEERKEEEDPKEGEQRKDDSGGGDSDQANNDNLHGSGEFDD